MLEFGKLNGGLNSPKHCYNISQGHKVTVVDTHQKIGLAVVVNYQADRFKQHLDICMMMMCKVICLPRLIRRYLPHSWRCCVGFSWTWVAPEPGTKHVNCYGLKSR